MSRSLKLFLTLAVLMTIFLLGYYWYHQPQVPHVGSVKGEFKEINSPRQDSASLPRIVITSPVNGERVASGFIVTRYILSGDLKEPLNLDILLTGTNVNSRHFVTPINGAPQGAYPLSDLETGEYNLVMRLQKQDGLFYNHAGAQGVVHFGVENGLN